MAGLTGKTIATAYKSLLRIDDDTNGIDTTAENVTDGGGTVSALKLSDDVVQLIPNNDDTTAAFSVRTKGGAGLLTVDTTNSVVKAGVGQFNVLTKYAYFGIAAGASASYAADTHQAIPFMTGAHSHLTYPPSFGTGTDPATTFTTSDDNTTRASDIAICMWYVPDNIYIDAVSAIEGADTATGEDTDMHLFSYTLNSGSTSCLTAGTLLAHNTPFTNAGDEQAYLTTWAIDSNSVAAGKVILAFFESVSTVNSDYSINITVKYHLV